MGTGAGRETPARPHWRKSAFTPIAAPRILLPVPTRVALATLVPLLELQLRALEGPELLSSPPTDGQWRCPSLSQQSSEAAMNSPAYCLRLLKHEQGSGWGQPWAARLQVCPLQSARLSQSGSAGHYSPPTAPRQPRRALLPHPLANTGGLCCVTPVTSVGTSLEGIGVRETLGWL